MKMKATMLGAAFLIVCIIYSEPVFPVSSINIWSENSSPKSEPKTEVLDVSFSPFLLFLSARSARSVPKFRILTSI